MGSGSYDSSTYTSSKSSRAASGTPDFAYTAKAAATKTIHPTLDPKRINTKPFKKLESRDSAEHPDSNAILLFFDVTGSNYKRAIVAQQKLNELMALLTKYIPDPQVAIGANDDFKVEPTGSIQISDFESDNRIDESIRNIWLVNNGGGNDGESYQLALYLAARKTVLDCVEKRDRKGYFFMYADEPIYSTKSGMRGHGNHEQFVDKNEVKAVFGDDLEANIQLEDIIAEVKQNFHFFILWPQGGFDHARAQYVELFGDESVVTLQDPNMICELVSSLVGMREAAVTPTGAVDDLVSVGVDRSKAEEVVGAASSALVIAGSNTSTSLTRGIPTGGASRL